MCNPMLICRLILISSSFPFLFPFAFSFALSPFVLSFSFAFDSNFYFPCMFVFISFLLSFPFLFVAVMNVFVDEMCSCDEVCLWARRFVLVFSGIAVISSQYTKVLGDFMVI